MTYHIDYAYTCHAGKVRPNNEDNFWCCGEHLPVSNHGTEEIRTGLRLRESLPVMAVFDGMGGESQGEMAAWLASDSLEHFYRENKGMLRKAPELFLTEACKDMNQAVCDYGREQRISAMGTTMAMIAFGKKEAYICNLGDSRIYRFSKGEFFPDFQRSCAEKLQIWESTTDSVSGSGGDRDEAGTCHCGNSLSGQGPLSALLRRGNRYVI
ncbi:MAG: PP2C family protein-serine/threonine phosphatase [Ruminococcus sp.]